MSQSGAVVLPLLTEREKFVWVQSEQIDLVGTPVLQEAFDRFPYLTRMETVALAQRCSIHPDQVKVWFMAQRLQYGISWEYEDILDTFMSRKELKEEEEEEAVATKKMTKEREKKSSRKKGKSKGSGERMQNMVNVRNKVGKKRVAASDKDLVVVQHENQTSGTSFLANRLPDLLKNMNLSSLSSDPENKPKIQNVLVGDAADLNDGLDVTDAPSTFAKQSKSESAIPLTHGNTPQRPHQLEVLKMTFLQYQYPDLEHYKQLAETNGIPRTSLVKWFNNMRHYIKKTRPRWMTVEQHRQAVANIMYRQYREFCSREGDDGEDQKVKRRRK